MNSSELERFMPILSPRYASLHKFYLQQVSCFWTTSEVDLSHDRAQFEEMSKAEQHFILTILSFFATSDRVVNENLAKNFSVEVDIFEASQFYAVQIGIEAIHTQMYGELITFYERDVDKQRELFRAVITNTSVSAKAEWALQYTSASTAFEKRLVAFACVEGIFFSASFCAIFYFKKRGLLPGLTFSNELISRDEGLHRDFACELYKNHYEKLTDSAVHEIVTSAVTAEKLFVENALPVKIIGMNSDMMMEYIEFVADHLLEALGHTKFYNTANPFEWMELISLQGKTNFFEKRVGEYAKAGVMAGNGNRNVFEKIDDF